MTLNRQAIRQQFDREMTKARERITTTANGEIGWLVQFIQRDLDALTPSEWMVLAYEVASFAEADGPDEARVPDRCRPVAGRVQASPARTLEYTLPSRKEAIHLQGTIRGHLEQLWQQRRRADHLFGSHLNRHHAGRIPRSPRERPGGDQT